MPKQALQFTTTWTERYNPEVPIDTLKTNYATDLMEMFNHLEDIKVEAKVVVLDDNGAVIAT